MCRAVMAPARAAPLCLPHSCTEAYLCCQLHCLELLVLVGLTATLAVIHRRHRELAGSLQAALGNSIALPEKCTALF